VPFAATTTTATTTIATSTTPTARGFKYTCTPDTIIRGTADVKLSNGKTDDTGYSQEQCQQECDASANYACKSIVYGAREGAHGGAGYCEMWSKAAGTSGKTGYRHCVQQTGTLLGEFHSPGPEGAVGLNSRGRGPAKAAARPAGAAGVEATCPKSRRPQAQRTGPAARPCLGPCKGIRMSALAPRIQPLTTHHPPPTNRCGTDCWEMLCGLVVLWLQGAWTPLDGPT